MLFHDTLYEIFSFLSCEDLVAINITSKDFQKTIDEMELYREFSLYRRTKQNFKEMLRDGFPTLFRYTYDGTDNQEYFALACQYNHLDIAKWLYSIGNVDIHKEDEKVFRLACSYGFIEIAQWLHNLGNINVNTLDNHSFQWACKYAHLSKN